MVKITVNDKVLEATEGKTVLEAALEAGIYIPNLCYHPDLPPVGACRLCIVEVEGLRGFPTSCNLEIREGMKIKTDTEKLRELRKDVLWLILSEYSGNIDEHRQLKEIVEYIGEKKLLPNFKTVKKNLPVIDDDPLYIRDPNLCILCGRCVNICQQVRGVGAIGFVNRSTETIIGTSFDEPLMDSGCKFCLACVEVCPTGALKDKYDCETEEDLIPCTSACPASVDIPLYTKLIAEGNHQDALNVVREKFPFPHVLGLVCNHYCEQACKRNDLNDPIAIRALKRFIAEKDDGSWKKKLTIAPDTGKKVAVIGSGPAGLTSAWFLRTKGHQVTVYEALERAGGMLLVGIPEYRLPKNILDQEIKEIENIGVKIVLNKNITSLDELKKEGFDAVFLALGAMRGTKMGIEGEDDPRVLDGVSVLKDINLGVEIDLGDTIAVVGGGDVAIDVARNALRLGSKNVVMIYRRTRAEMPADPDEIHEALEEKIDIRFLTNPARVLPDKNNLKIECIKMELGPPDDSGRRRPVPIPNSEHILELDRLVMAIGQKPVIPDGLDVKLDRWGCIDINDEMCACREKGVFAAGDAVTGPGVAIEAIEGGKKAASAIDIYLGGDGKIEQTFYERKPYNAHIGRKDGFSAEKRSRIPMLPADTRVNSFDQVELGFDELSVMTEASRCLSCQLRMEISKVPLPSDFKK